MPRTYRVLTWDHEIHDWAVQFEHLTAREAVRKVRALERCGYDRHLSIYVERIGTEPEAHHETRGASPSVAGPPPHPGGRREVS